MSTDSQFNGLPMPVFTAFGWAGEDAAISFALSHLETFVKALHKELSPHAQLEFPLSGVNNDAQLVYLAANREPEDGAYITFIARPTTFELRLCLTNRLVVHRGLRSGENDPAGWHRMLQSLGEGWTLQLEQRLIEEESGAESHYNDLFKDQVLALSAEDSQKMISRAVFLNGEEKWAIRFYLSYRMSADQASAQNSGLTRTVAEKVDSLLPLVAQFARQQKRSKSTVSKNGSTKVRKTKTGGSRTSRATKSTSKTKTVVPEVMIPATFSYETEVKPLYIRKGFINLTSRHWPFFAESARMETRPVTIQFGEQEDKSGSVWRLQPDDIARLVLGDSAHGWFEKHFQPNSRVSITATRMPDNEIQVTISAA
ncbi:MAG: hypothetical protein AAF633_03285 [Chloroflexota bacterium]